MDNKWKKVLRLIKKSGDRAVVMDNESSEAFVVLALSDYERLLEKADGVVDLTEEQFLDRIDQDINGWSRENEKAEMTPDQYPDERAWLAGEPANNGSSSFESNDKEEPADDQYYIEPVE